jgi:hypothetical protein
LRAPQGCLRPHDPNNATPRPTQPPRDPPEGGPLDEGQTVVPPLLSVPRRTPAEDRTRTLAASDSSLVKEHCHSTTATGRSSSDSSAADPRKPLLPLALQLRSRARDRVIPDRGTGDLTDPPAAVKAGERRIFMDFASPELTLNSTDRTEAYIEPMIRRRQPRCRQHLIALERMLRVQRAAGVVWGQKLKTTVTDGAVR